MVEDHKMNVKTIKISVLYTTSCSLYKIIEGL